MNFRFIKEKNPLNEEYKVNFFIKAIGSGLFSGYIPFASGTFGSLVGFLIYLIPGFADIHILFIAVILSFSAGVYVSNTMSKRYGEDPPEVVIDEISGLWFTYLVGYFVFAVFITLKTYDPTTDFTKKLIFAIVGFFVFRLFDIIKLQPAKYLDSKKGGWGIMLDDTISAIYAGVLSAILTHFLWYRIFIHKIQ
jgi:phosphatidylglycerophosphatase A